MKSIKYALIFLWNEILNLVYPKQCIICGKLDDGILCEKCYNNEFRSKIIKEAKLEKHTNKNFNEHLYIFKYEGKIRNLIIDYKFKDKPYLYELFVKFIIKNEKICRKIKKYDIIIPVPIHRKRKKERGYDQSELIARKITEKFKKLEFINNVLIKNKHTVRQSSLTREQREQNVKKVYKLQNVEKIYNKKIILFDDIYTTGATCNECARLLMENGAKEVLVFTIAKD